MGCFTQSCSTALEKQLRSVVLQDCYLDDVCPSGLDNKQLKQVA
jgi:hypothetical protein